MATHPDGSGCSLQGFGRFGDMQPGWAERWATTSATPGPSGRRLAMSAPRESRHPRPNRWTAGVAPEQPKALTKAPIVPKLAMLFSALRGRGMEILRG